MPKKKTGRAAAGAGSIRQRPDGRWEGRITIGTNPGTGKPDRRSVYGDTQQEVRKKLAALQTQVDNGTYQAPSKMTVEQWCKTWLETFVDVTLKPQTITSYHGSVRLHIIPAIGALKLQDVRGYHVQSLYNAMLKQGLSPKTVKNTGAILHKAFTVAVKQRLIAFNPCDAAELPKGQNFEASPLTEDTIPAFLQAIEADPMCNAYRLCLFTGLREGELLGLSWENIDLKAARLTVCQQLQKEKKKGGKYYIAPYTKSSRNRVVELPPIAVDCLKDEKIRQMQARLKAGPAWRNEWNLVFTNECGEHLSIVTFYNHYKRIVKKIGRPDARPHDLRHTWATEAVDSGADIKSVQNSLGHATPAFTLAKYVHASDKAKKETAAKMQTVFEAYDKAANGSR